MITKKIDLALIRKMFEAGARQIEANFEYINQLNIFPVPDGDTGTNMKFTAIGAADSTRGGNYNSLGQFGRAFARETLMNARGNSGVIFSQIIKGFTKLFPDDKSEMTLSQFIACFKEARETAYQSVVKPVEGTILTVVRVLSEELLKKTATFKSFEELFAKILEIANKTLNKTPEMLPELRQAGVVDSGAYGLVQFFVGMEAALTGKEAVTTTRTKNTKLSTGNIPTRLVPVEAELDENGHGYCTEFLLSLGLKADDKQEKQVYREQKLREDIDLFVNSVVIVSDLDEGIVKLHAHTLHPHQLLQAGLQFGEFIKVKIDNMNLQVSARKEGAAAAAEQVNTHEILAAGETTLADDIRIVATAPSRALGETLRESYGVNNYIDTDVHGNPSIGLLVNAIKQCGSKNVIIVVDDKNIVFAANEAIKQLRGYIECDLVVGANFVEGMAAISAFLPEEKNLRANVKAMRRSMRDTMSACFSTSIKNVKYPHITVHKDDCIGIVDGKVVSAEKERVDAIAKAVEIIMRKVRHPELAIVIYGAKVSLREVRQIEKMITEKYGVYCEAIAGNQKIYSYYVGVQ